MRLLVVEDESRVAGFLRKGLREEGYAVDLADDGPSGLAMVHGGDYDAVILDVMLPGKSGFQVTAELRSGGDSTPILLLTAKDSRDDIVRGLDAGADDYLTKPFDFEELLARIRALSRRRPVLEEQILSFRDLEMDRARRTVRRGNREVDLTPTEFSILEALLERRGDVAKRTELLNEVWGIRFDPGTNLLDVHVANLRRKLEEDGRPRLVQTVRGVGFHLASPDEG
jgi:DNA-binding response OmpR family regulator